jgi:predicted  nucleic acid-binding Zn-ribbon protein
VLQLPQLDVNGGVLPLSIRTELDQLLELQVLDTQRDLALRSRSQIGNIKSAQDNLTLAQAEADAAKSAMNLSARALKDAELELASIETKIAAYEQKMRSGQLTNSREIANVEKEMHQLNRQRSSLDDKILNFMEQSEIAHTLSAGKDSRLQASQIALDNQRELSRQTLEKLNTQINRLDSERGAIAECIGDGALVKRYEALRARPATAGLAAVKIDSDRHCGGCHLPVSQQYAERVKEAASIVTCENCGRILA